MELSVLVVHWQVKLLESMQSMDEEAFKAYFGDELTWTATLSDGSVVHLNNVASSHVQFADRLTYIDLVKQARMKESQQQVCNLLLPYSLNGLSLCLWFLCQVICYFSRTILMKFAGFGTPVMILFIRGRPNKAGLIVRP